MIELGLALDGLVSLFRRFKSLFVIVPLALALAWQTARIEGFLWFDGLKDKLAKAETTIAQMELASKQARAAQIAANMATEARYRAESEKTDADYRKALEGALRAADRYALGHRVRPDCSRSPGPAIAAPENPTPPDNDGPGPMPDMVAVPRPEFEDFVANTIRLDQIVNGYGKGLIEEGLAVKPVTAADIPEVGF